MTKNIRNNLELFKSFSVFTQKVGIYLSLFYPYQFFPVEIAYKLFQEKEKEKEKEIRDEMLIRMALVQSALDQLVKYEFVVHSDDRQEYKVNDEHWVFLDGRFQKSKYKKKARKTYAYTLAEVCRSMEQDLTKQDFEKLRKLIPHIHSLSIDMEYALALWQQKPEDSWFKPEDLMDVLTALGRFHDFIGLPERAKSYYSNCLRLAEIIFRPNHPCVIVSLNNLGLINFDLGDYNTAKALFSKALDLQEEVNEKIHLYTSLT